jgi:hypothetical protein
MLFGMTDRCLELQSKSGKCSDDFYRALKDYTTQKRTSRQSMNAGRRCGSLARIYEDSLDQLLACLREDENSEAAQQKIDQTLECKRLLVKDIALIPSA